MVVVVVVLVVVVGVYSMCGMWMHLIEAISFLLLITFSASHTGAIKVYFYPSPVTAKAEKGPISVVVVVVVVGWVSMQQSVFMALLHVRVVVRAQLTGRERQQQSDYLSLSPATSSVR